jgi:hypothetical protein
MPPSNQLFDELSRAQRAELTMSDVLTWPSTARSFVLWLVQRQSATVEEMCAYTGLEPDALGEVVALMLERQWLTARPAGSKTSYRVRLRVHGKASPLLKDL